MKRRLLEEKEIYLYKDEETGDVYYFDGEKLVPYYKKDRPEGKPENPLPSDSPIKSENTPEEDPLPPDGPIKPFFGDELSEEDKKEALKKQAEDIKNELIEKGKDISLVDKVLNEFDNLTEEQIEKLLNEATKDLYSHKSLSNLSDLFDNENLFNSVEKENDSAIQKEQRIKERKKKEAEAKKGAEKYSNGNVDGGLDLLKRDINYIIGHEVQEAERKADYKKINKHYEFSGIERPGYKTNINFKKPKLQVYFDQSGSWDLNDIAAGNTVLSTIKSLYVDKGKLDLEVYYFDNHVYSNIADVQRGGTGAFEELMEKIQSDKPDNVMIMTDEDFDHWSDRDDFNIHVPGGVFLLFRNGELSQRLIKSIHGRKLTRVYTTT